MNNVLVVGSVALDNIESPAGCAENILGGAASYASIAASLFAPTRLVGIVGGDFPEEHLQLFRDRNIDLEGLQIDKSGKTFRWSGDYNDDLNQANTHETHLGVFETFNPTLPDSHKQSTFVLLGNINPELQLRTLEQVSNPKLVLCDTMNLWINLAREKVLETFSKVHVAVLNDTESKMLTGDDNVITAGKKLQNLGPQHVIIKKGEHGALMFSDNDIFASPSFPLDEVKDPTGAGDSFAGAFMGYLASTDDLSAANLRRAVVYGSVVASATVQDFSATALAKLSREEVESRFNAMRQLSQF
ncbi:MAG: PfkB family carbohydrate kinase [Abditibacteriaceae bacterium]